MQLCISIAAKMENENKDKGNKSWLDKMCCCNVPHRDIKMKRMDTQEIRNNNRKINSIKNILKSCAL